MKNSKRLYVRLSEEDIYILESKCERLKISKSEMIRSLIKNKPIKVQPIPDTNTLRLKNEIAQMGRNIWRLLKVQRKLNLKENIELIDINIQLQKVIKTINSHYDSKNYKV